jgi:hypothetical protein
LDAISDIVPVICLTNGSINLSPFDGQIPYSFVWSNGETTEDISNLTEGTYVVTITDANGCEIIHSSIVEETNSGLTFNNIIVTDEICGNGEGAIDISIINGLAPYTYNWSNGETTEDIINLSANTYSVTVTDAYGCDTIGVYDILNNPGTLNIDTLLAHHINCNTTLGWVDLTYSGGTEPVNILWNNGETEEDAEDLATGVYAVTITDANGCEDIASTEIFDYDNFQIDNTVVTDDTCSLYLGGVNLSVSGGMLPYTFAWSNGSTSEDLYGITGGYYQCTITTADGCELTTGNMFVDNIDGFTLSVAITHASCSTCNDGAIDLSEVGSGSSFTFLWTGPSGFTANTEDIQDLIPGNYTVHVENDLGCSNDSTYEVSFTNLIGENVSDIRIVAYPNPTNGPLVIEYELEEQVNEIAIYNVVGQRVLTQKLTDANGKITLNFEDLAYGIYHVKLYTENEVYMLKVMHQRDRD